MVSSCLIVIWCLKTEIHGLIFDCQHCMISETLYCILIIGSFIKCRIRRYWRLCWLAVKGVGAISWVNQRGQRWRVKKCLKMVEAKSGGVKVRLLRLYVSFQRDKSNRINTPISVRTLGNNKHDSLFFNISSNHIILICVSLQIYLWWNKYAWFAMTNCRIMSSVYVDM